MAEAKFGEISGVVVEPRRRIPDERGTILHGVRAEQLSHPFGEVYFKKLYFGVINGWHVHEHLFINYICVHGMIKIVLYDLRSDSSTFGIAQEIFMGDDNYCMVHIPPGIANGAKGMTDPFALMCNVASHAHDPSVKYRRIDPHTREIPYDWRRRDF
jgi:dTDP-4-dehydrorhamnose 3,5-epimerase